MQDNCKMILIYVNFKNVIEEPDEENQEEV